MAVPAELRIFTILAVKCIGRMTRSLSHTLLLPGRITNEHHSGTGIAGPLTMRSYIRGSFPYPRYAR